MIFKNDSLLLYGDIQYGCMYEQEIRSVERGYLSHCFKSRTRDLGHAPFGVIRPFLAAILDFSITKYGDDQIHGFIRFLDPKNPGKDTKIISLARFIEELRMIL